jgi:hypothetical protein
MDDADKTIRCDCGYKAAAGDEETLLGELQQHARDAHGIELARERALLIVLGSGLEDALSETSNDERSK